VRQGSQAGYKMFCTNGKVVTETLERKKEKNTKKERGTQPKWFSMQSWPLLVRSWSLTLQTKNSFSFFLFFDFTGYTPSVSPRSFSCFQFEFVWEKTKMIHRRFGVQFGLEQRNLFVVSM
jgi:hypothetical protein